MIRLARSVRGAVVAHAREGAPEEVCGVLGGRRAAGGDTDEATATDEATDDGEGTDAADDGPDAASDAPDVITAARRVANVADAPRDRYELDPGEQLAAMRDLEDGGDDVVGFYHSHPRGPDGPSPTDERLATWPGRVYLIVSLGGRAPTVRAYRWTGEAFDEVPVVVSADP